MRFLLIDKILKLSPGKSIVATKTMQPDEELFRDHFPGFPVVPGVLLTEMMAQAAGKCLDAEKSPRGRAMLGRISNATFRHWVPPGETAIITATIDSNREEFATAKCYVEVKDKKVCSADLFFVFVPHGQFAVGYCDEVLDSYLRENRLHDTEPGPS